MSQENHPNLDLLAARAGVEWATKVRSTFRVLGATIPPAWPGTRAGARSLVDQICDAPAPPDTVERLTDIVEARAERAWKRIRCFSGEAQSTEETDEQEAPLSQRRQP